MDYIRKLEKNKSKTLVEEYFEIQKEFEEKYGEKTILLYENGSFFEFYKVNEKGKADEICELLNSILTKKNKSIPEVTMENPQMAGFPSTSINRHLPILLNDGWVVVLIEQISSQPYIERAITKVYTKSTYIENISEKTTNYTMTIVFSEDEYKNKKYLRCGWSIFDFSIGKSFFGDVETGVDKDYHYIYEEIQKIILSFCPTQFIVYCVDNKFDESFVEDFKDRFKISKNVFYMKTLEENLDKVSFQENYLSKIFHNDSVLSTIEYLNLEKNDLSRLSYVLTLKYIENQQFKLIKNLELPIYYHNIEFMQLENNAIEQLEIYNQNKDCLFEMINLTTTSMGRRLLLYRLLNPLISPEKITERYDFVERFLSDDFYKKVEQSLKGIYDMERIHRKMSLDSISPVEVSQYYVCFQKITGIIDTVCDSFLYEKMNVEHLKQVCEKIQDFFEETFHLQELPKYYQQDITTKIFKNVKELDEMWETYEKEYTTLELYAKTLGGDIRIERNDEEFSFKTTPKKAEIMYKSLRVNDIIDISKITLDKHVKSYTKIVSPEITHLSNKLVKILRHINTLSYKLFSEKIKSYYETYHSQLEKICNFVAEMDFYKSLAKSSVVYNLSRPMIVESEKSFIKATKIRHLIVEKISKQEFITNDVDIGERQNGYLIFGINGIGKSVYLKSVALCVILAQMGCYVPCKEMVYCPYKNIMTRILNNDNIYKGYSSFMVEMIELKKILLLCNPHSLILADELTHGTEIYSGTSIITTTILQLLKKRSSFVFTTHLHNIMKLEEIQNVVEKNELKIFHMGMKYDLATDSIFYERKLIEGSGEAIYGLECCRALHLPPEFLSECNEIRKKLLQETEIKPSNYNRELIVEKCFLCDSTVDLHTHHIQEQHKAGKNGFIESFHKNNFHNLVVLCEKCHHRVHDGEIVIEGWKFTSKGNKLVYKYLKMPQEVETYIKNNEGMDEKTLKKNIKKLFDYNYKN